MFWWIPTYYAITVQAGIPFEEIYSHYFKTNIFYCFTAYTYRHNFNNMMASCNRLSQPALFAANDLHKGLEVNQNARAHSNSFRLFSVTYSVCCSFPSHSEDDQF